MPHSKRTSATVSDDGESPIYSWSEHGSPYSYLSQWYPSPFIVESTGITYTTAEQYMMHQKALLFSDSEIAVKILSSTSPKSRNILGEKCPISLTRCGRQIGGRIVEEASYWKFQVGRDEGVSLRNRLLGTMEREIVEASPRGRFWGVGFGEKNAEKRRTDWGLNLLEKAVIDARKKLTEEGSETDEVPGKAEGESEKAEPVDDGERHVKRQKKSNK
ncbi:hypothetical protein WAI453_003959 [Rhynchosporium graminicola]